jgi:adenylate cyclase
LSQGQRRLAAIMFTDMVGYTALGQRNELLSLALVEEQKKIVRPILTRHNGREVKTIGDAFLVEFPNAVDAVRCSYDIQRAVREFNLSLSPDKRIHLRVGVHVGEVVESEGDISGDAVNVASRIEPLAEEDGVCVTRQVFDHIQGKVDLAMSSLGSKWVKNVAVPIEVYRMIMPWEGEGGGAAPRLDTKRVAVLPFASMSPDPADEYFADGLTEELIDRLCQVKELGVIARTSVMNYKGQKKNASEIGKELKAGGLVEGSIRKAGNRIRVTAQLINANTEEHLWSSHYDKDLDDVFAVQSDIAEKVVQELRVHLVEQEKRALEKKPTESTEAYTYFLQGTYLLRGGEEAPIRHALGLFEQAVSLDPGFARAYVGIARCHLELAYAGYASFEEALRQSRTWVAKALELDPALAEAQVTRADVLFMADDLKGAQDEIRRALELNPNIARAYLVYAHASAALGETDEMITNIEKAYQLDPLSPEVIRYVGQYYLYAGRKEDCLRHSIKTSQLDPYGTNRYLFDYYIETQDLEGAEKSVEEMERLGPTLVYTYLNRGYLAAITGDAKTAREAISRLESDVLPGTARFALAGVVYLGLGDVDKFFEYMAKAIRDHTLPASLLRYNPVTKKVRSDPRFAEIFEKTKIPFSPKT